MSSVVDYPSQGTVGVTRKPKRIDIDLYQGDSYSFYLAFTGTSLDVTGWTATSTVKKVSDSTTVASVITIGAVDTVNKRFLITVDSDLLTPETEYKYDVQVTSPGSPPQKRTFVGGKINVDEDITES